MTPLDVPMFILGRVGAMPVVHISASAFGIAPQCMGQARLMDLESDYARTVLSIKTAVNVTLARKKVPLDRIVDLVPGAMLTFDAHCDEPLILEAGGKPIATGETVKIGDKFGLRIREILVERPEED